MTVVVDASVATKWLVPEDGTDDAERLLAGLASLHVPDLIYPEVANALWKRVHRGQMARSRAETVLGVLAVMPLISHDTRSMIPAALTLACALDITVYDSVYVALAEMLDTTVVTADRRLLAALKGTRLARRGCWIGDLTQIMR